MGVVIAQAFGSSEGETKVGVGVQGLGCGVWGLG